MTEIGIPEAPQARKDFMLNILKDEGCSVFTPTKVELSDEFQLLQETQNTEDEQDAKSFLNRITTYLSTPIVIDRFGSNNKARETWRRQMEKKWGNLFKDIYQQGRLRRIKMAVAITAISCLMQPDFGFNLGINQEEWKEASKMLKPELADGEKETYDPYAHLGTADKMKVVDKVNQLSWRALASLVPSSALSKPENQELLEEFTKWNSGDYLRRNGTSKKVQRGE